MLGLRRRQWSNIEPALRRRCVFDVIFQTDQAELGCQDGSNGKRQN